MVWLRRSQRTRDALALQGFLKRFAKDADKADETD